MAARYSGKSASSQFYLGLANVNTGIYEHILSEYLASPLLNYDVKNGREA